MSVSNGEAGKRALTALKELYNFMLDGKVNVDILPILYKASLCAKKRMEEFV